ncbi:hypothetical protein R1X32_01675 (plasmid) [Rhodococcus opacus]|uniref:hypothetical protein n=1 Tax=Rhodococcus TaxID=1827 RepID=UPI00141FAE93|nr:hypothetical protein [Rhodococcus sp. A14]WKN61257.1 hypothetical protein HJ581_0047605 [Rhodococcus opacus]
MGVHTTIDPVTGDQIPQYPETANALLDHLIGGGTGATAVSPDEGLMHSGLNR